MSTDAKLRDDVAALTDSLDRLAQHHSETAQLAAAAARDMDETAGAVARLEASVAGLARRLDPGPEDDDEHDEDTDEDEGEDEPAAWVDYAGAKEWVALADWVDWLMLTYDLADDKRVLPCWPAHLGVTEELAALRSAWRDAAGRARGVDSDALAYWHDRYLAPFLARANSQYGTRACQSTRHAPIMRPRLADRTLIDVRSAADPGQTA